MKKQNLVPFFLALAFLLYSQPSLAMKRHRSTIYNLVESDENGFDPVRSLWGNVGIPFLVLALSQINQWMDAGEVPRQLPTSVITPEPFHSFALAVVPSPNPAEALAGIQHMLLSFQDSVPLLFNPYGYDFHEIPTLPSREGEVDLEDTQSIIHVLFNHLGLLCLPPASAQTTFVPSSDPVEALAGVQHMRYSFEVSVYLPICLFEMSIIPSPNRILAQAGRQLLCFSSQIPAKKKYKVAYVRDKHRYLLKIFPKESFIRKAVNEVFIPVLFRLEATSICPYVAKPEIVRQVEKLPFFEDIMMIPAMENGHIKLPKGNNAKYWDHVSRGYTIGPDKNIVQGCIHFAVYAKSNFCLLESLGIDSDNAGKGLGSSLLQAGIYIASLYGCNSIELQSSPEAVLTYAKHGFWMIEAGYDEDDVDWQNFAHLTPDELVKLAQEHDYYMRLDFENEEYLALLDKYMERHAKPAMRFSELIKKNRAMIGYYERQLTELMMLLRENSEESLELARKRFKDLSQYVDFSEDIRRMLGLHVLFPG